MSALYTASMNEYLALNHMEKVTSDCENCSENYCISHHAVFRPESISTPLRVVFDASAKCANGVSLNSLLLNGGIVQQDLFSIVTRFRTHTYVFSTDITKMYRQILVEETDRELQRILWKSSSCSPVETYRLRTITYGTTCAPYLATRTLKALAEEVQVCFPRASAVLFTDVYVNDILSGSENLEDTISLQVELINLLNKGGIQLHKCVSNHPDLLNDNKAIEYNFSSDSHLVKTLGMFWACISDNLTFKVNIESEASFIKRDVLSTIASLFDPLGLIGPVITRAKIFLQNLWRQKLKWSDPIPPNDVKEWLNFLIQLPALNQVRLLGIWSLQIP
ncbi:uncharacterized protein LOC118188330 [Stegodyphus dumicola]|uniref:uncharacterized protein LOC118188330 n=1 Tax=Stegodyphus dumicola TaxID=202533 RepID=UPI0015ABDCB6|nr:uncharacterized protein LOC118188330 [Stegodyphus dumicola]